MIVEVYVPFNERRVDVATEKVQQLARLAIDRGIVVLRKNSRANSLLQQKNIEGQ